LSVFKTKWIIIKIYKIAKNEFLYTIFSHDYGKIKANKKIAKKEKNLDLWYIINFEIQTKKDIIIHKIRNIKILSDFNYEKKSFQLINNYLELIAIILKNAPEWVPIFEIYNIFEYVNNYEKLTEEKILLAKLKIINVLWELTIDSEDKIVKKILNFIHKNNIKEIFRLKWIWKMQKNLLENIF
jgi:hypothetical protein